MKLWFEKCLGVYESLAVYEYRMFNTLHRIAQIWLRYKNNNEIGPYVRSFDSPSTTRRTSGT